MSAVAVANFRLVGCHAVTEHRFLHRAVYMHQASFSQISTLPVAGVGNLVTFAAVAESNW